MQKWALGLFVTIAGAAVAMVYQQVEARGSMVDTKIENLTGRIGKHDVELGQNGKMFEHITAGIEELKAGQKEQTDRLNDALKRRR